MLKPTHATCRGNDTHISTVDGGQWLGVGYKRLFVGVEERNTVTGHHTEIFHPFLRKATHTATATATETRVVRCTIPTSTRQLTTHRSKPRRCRHEQCAPPCLVVVAVGVINVRREHIRGIEGIDLVLIVVAGAMVCGLLTLVAVVVI